MYFDVFISGFGGQGILLAGNLLSEAAMEKGYNVTFFPSYGVEMRGGTARCTVVISTSEIGSPIIDRPHCVIAMNQPSLTRYQHSLADDGLLLVNSSLTRDDPLSRTGIRAVRVPLTDLAVSLGNARLANMVALGAFARLSGIISPEEVAASLPAVVSERHRALLPLNEKAVMEGAEAAGRADQSLAGGSHSQM